MSCYISKEDNLKKYNEYIKKNRNRKRKEKDFDKIMIKVKWGDGFLIGNYYMFGFSEDSTRKVIDIRERWWACLEGDTVLWECDGELLLNHVIGYLYSNEEIEHARI